MTVCFLDESLFLFNVQPIDENGGKFRWSEPRRELQPPTGPLNAWNTFSMMISSEIYEWQWVWHNAILNELASKAWSPIRNLWLAGHFIRNT